MKSAIVNVVVFTWGISIMCAPLSAQPSPTAPTLKLSKPDWTAQDPFSTAPEVRVLSNGTVIVADYQETEVRLIDNFGKTIRQLGRKGSGPAEYTDPMKLIAMKHDTTLLLDREARRILTIDPQGKFWRTQSIPGALGRGAEALKSADDNGRIYFSIERDTKIEDPDPSSAPILAWLPGKDVFDTVTMLAMEATRPVKAKPPKGGKLETLYAKFITVYAPKDDWIASRTGRVAIIHANPYHVEWIEADKSKTVGANVAYAPVPVTDRDKKAREPKGPPYRRNYAKTKSPFEPLTAVLDDAENIWVRRYDLAGSVSRRWDVFNRKGNLVNTITLPADRYIKEINAKHAYLVRIDTDGSYWLERYTR